MSPIDPFALWRVNVEFGLQMAQSNIEIWARLWGLPPSGVADMPDLWRAVSFGAGTPIGLSLRACSIC